MKFFMLKKLLQYYLPLTLTLFMLVTIERTVTTDGGFEKLYGLPFPYIADAYACSLCYVVFIPAMIFNLLFYFGITLLFKLLQKAGWSLKTHWVLIVTGTGISLYWITVFVFMTADAFFQFKVDTDYALKSQQIVFELKP